ncbi:MAG: hypothetical protein K8J09_23600 [Planctomycetes bacterium]|nr:hypothetical protein [Planctomycetota bacterium]
MRSHDPLPCLPASFFVLAGAMLPAQQVFLDASATAPILVTAALPGDVSSQSQPAGPLPLFGVLQAQTAGFEVTARASWSFWASTQAATFDLHLSTVAAPLPFASATSGEHEVLVQLRSSVPMTADLQLSATLAATAGTPTPLVRIDVFDDGLGDLSEASPQGMVVLNLSPTPVPVRLRARAEATAGGLQNVHVGLRLVPHNDLSIVPFVTGCTDESALTATPSFLGQGLDFQVVSGVPQDLHVLGLAAAPIALPPIAGSPCILLPQPDLVIPLPPWTYHEHVSIPPAVRPLQLFAQAARFGSAGILLTDGLRVLAN